MESPTRYELLGSYSSSNLECVKTDSEVSNLTYRLTPFFTVIKPVSEWEAAAFISDDAALGAVASNVELELTSPCPSFDSVIPSKISFKVLTVQASSAILFLPTMNFLSCLFNFFYLAFQDGYSAYLRTHSIVMRGKLPVHSLHFFQSC